MADLTESEVRALARALALPLTDEDAAEVTHRLNAFIEALEPLMGMDAGGPDAAPAPVDPDAAG
jgi:Asp-tRNA(Asn)/Glu-tRNA(Gln) amidotransferase C subunit